MKNCKNCGANSFDFKFDKYYCNYCGSVFNVTEVSKKSSSKIFEPNLPVTKYSINDFRKCLVLSNRGGVRL